MITSHETSHLVVIMALVGKMTQSFLIQLLDGLRHNHKNVNHKAMFLVYCVDLGCS
jgi:hypothetical protein